MSVPIHGHCDPLFQPLADAFSLNFEEGLEFGASLGVMHRGRLVVDLWAGHADAGRAKPWERDTVEVVFSLTKVPLMFAFLRLIDSGRVDLDATVATYWPEFAQGGKGHVTIRDALSHQAGVPGFNPPLTFEQHMDWKTAADNLAAQPHWFGGVRQAAYHSNTYGHLLGEIMRRVDGRMPDVFLREEITAPAGIDFQIGMPLEEQGRIADLVVTRPPAFGEIGAINERIMASLGDGDWFAPATKAANLPATNGYGNGRSLAQLLSIGADLGVCNGERYVSEALIREAVRPHGAADRFMLKPAIVGFGLGLPSSGFPSPTPTSAHWGGYGGSQGWFDYDRGVSYAHVVNHLIVSPPEVIEPRWQRLWDALGQVARAL